MFGDAKANVQKQNARNAIPVGNQSLPLPRSFLARDLVFGAFIYLAISNAINTGLAAFDYNWVKPEMKERQFWLIWFEITVVIILFSAAYLMIRLDPDGRLFHWLFDVNTQEMDKWRGQHGEEGKKSKISSKKLPQKAKEKKTTDCGCGNCHGCYWNENYNPDASICEDTNENI